MTRIKVGIALLALVLMVAGWYAFRPERAFIDKHVDEAAPKEVARVVATGSFVPMAHAGRGRAQLMQLSDGRRILRFSGFETLDGPDVRVYLIGSPSIKRGNAGLDSAGYLDLGPLKGNVGDQNYEIPASADLTRFRAVAVWCRRFAVNFTEAELSGVGG